MHPDMDSKIFKEMWDIVKSGKSWHGEIKKRKNRRRLMSKELLG